MIRALLGREYEARWGFPLAASVISGFLCLSSLGGVLFPAPYRSEPFTLLNSILLSGLYWQSMVLAGLLGLQQVRAETQARTESLLFHRPVTRLHLFASKMLFGILVILLAPLVPFLVLVTATALPGYHVGPFRWEMAYPGIAQIASSLPFYAAVFWAACGQGRERWAGIAAALITLVWSLAYAAWGAPPLSEAAHGVLFVIMLLGALNAYRGREA